MILDSSFLIDVQRESRCAVEKASEIEFRGAPKRVPLVVVYELFVGVGKGTRTEENRRRVERVIEQLPFVSLTESIAKRAGRLDGILRRDSQKLGPPDAIVAATALEYDEPVVTGDVSDFERIPAGELQVETY